MRLPVLLGLLLCLSLPHAAISGAALDPLQDAKRLIKIKDSTDCDPKASALCAAGKMSLVQSAGPLIFKSSGCSPTGCVGEAGDLIAAGGPVVRDLEAALAGHFVAVRDPRFAEKSGAVLAELSKPCRFDKVFYTSGRLEALVRIDQAIRASPCPPGENPCWEAKRAQMTWIDGVSSAWIESIFNREGWPDLRVYGAKADDNAWLLAQHADARPALQKRALGLLRAAAAKGATTPQHLAYLEDRIAMKENKPQIYGTQFTCTPGKGWAPLPLLEPEKVDERRARVGLGTLADYAKVFSSPC